MPGNSGKLFRIAHVCQSASSPALTSPATADFSVLTRPGTAREARLTTLKAVELHNPMNPAVTFQEVYA